MQMIDANVFISDISYNITQKEEAKEQKITTNKVPVGISKTSKWYSPYRLINWPAF